MKLPQLTITADLIAEGPRGYSQGCRGAVFVSREAAQSLQNDAALDVIESHPFCPITVGFDELVCGFSEVGDIACLEDVSLCEDRGPVDNISELADISRPMVGTEAAHQFRRDAFDSDWKIVLVLMQKVLHEHGDVINSIS